MYQWDHKQAVYNILGIDKEGRKDLPGVYVSGKERANVWLSVLRDLHNRGLKDRLIACLDKLTGFEQAIQRLFPQNRSAKLCGTPDT